MSIQRRQAFYVEFFSRTEIQGYKIIFIKLFYVFFGVEAFMINS